MSNGLWPSLCAAGTLANRPVQPSEIPAGTFVFYLATDSGQLFIWNPVSNAWTAGTAQVLAVGAALTAKAVSGVTYALDTAAGSVLTLPAATGSGITFDAYVKTSATSNAHKILASPATDKLIGRATGSVAAGTTLQFSGAVAAAYHSIQMPFAGTQPSGGLEGDIFRFKDVAPGVWLVEATYESGTTSTTPFSTATT